MIIPEHIKWLVEECDIEMRDEKIIKCYKLNYDLEDDQTLRIWAKHIRRQYESDESLAESLEETGMTAEEYLRENVIPQKGMEKGATMRSADFGEIVFSDLLEFIYDFEVPRCKLYNRATPTQSEQGTDILAYKFYNPDYKPHPEDQLSSVESKMGATTSDFGTLNKAIKDSIKDEFRYSMTLNYYRKKLKSMGKHDEARRVARFQMKSEKDYIKRLIAGAAISRVNVEHDVQIDFKDEGEIRLTKIDSIFLIHCGKLMDLVHDLYERCIE